MDQQAKNDLEQALRHFTGSEALTRYSPVFPWLVITDGVIYLAETAGCYWLLDEIAAHLLNVHPDESFVAIHLKDTTKLTVEDGNGSVYLEQVFEWTTFPFDDFTFFAGRNELGGWTLMLPSEY
jgi:hypothetical protein